MLFAYFESGRQLFFGSSIIGTPFREKISKSTFHPIYPVYPAIDNL